MNKVRVLIVDDERAAREEIKRALIPYADYEITGEAKNAADAATLIASLQPELLFLDVQMPEGSGFDLLASLEEVPDVIFTTAYDSYAVQAFDNNALDYLLKPIRTERFAQAMEKHQNKRIERAALQKSRLPEKQFFVKDGNNYFFVQQKEIFLVESADNYARLHFRQQHALTKISLNLLEEKLDPAAFFRINRHQIIHKNYITNISITPAGRFLITLHNTIQLEVSGRQSVKFRQWNKI